jgi:putative membrane protein
VGVYRTLITAIADAVRAVRTLVGLASGGPSLRLASSRLRALPWHVLLPLAIGMVSAVVLGARFIEPLLEDYPVRMRALFFGLVLAGIVVPARLVLRTGPERWRILDIAVASAFAALLFWLTGLPPQTIDDPAALVVLLSAAVAICALVLPGISGSFLLLSVGMYEPTISAVNDRNLGYVAVFALGAIIGLGSFVTLLKWLLTNHAHITLVAVTGLMAGSLRALWPWQGPDRELLAPVGDIGVVLLIGIAGCAVVALLLLVERLLGSSEG